MLDVIDLGITDHPSAPATNKPTKNHCQHRGYRHAGYGRRFEAEVMKSIIRENLSGGRNRLVLAHDDPGVRTDEVSTSGVSDRQSAKCTSSFA
jgi:hypothetical protein